MLLVVAHPARVVVAAAFHELLVFIADAESLAAVVFFCGMQTSLNLLLRVGFSFITHSDSFCYIMC